MEDSLSKMIQCVAKNLVDSPDEVRVVVCEGESVTIYELHCNIDDVGKIIGKSGRNVNSLRILMQSIGTKMKKRVHLEVIQKR